MVDFSELEEISEFEFEQINDMLEVLEDIDEEYLEKERIIKAKKERIQIREILNANNISSDGRKRL